VKETQGNFVVVVPSPGTPGEGQGEGLSLPLETGGRKQNTPHPNPLPEYREREKSADTANALVGSALRTVISDRGELVRSADPTRTTCGLRIPRLAAPLAGRGRLCRDTKSGQRLASEAAIESQISRGRLFSRPRYSGGGQGRGFGR
jgi:hypothetical protein